MSAFSSEERAFIASIKERKEARERELRAQVEARAAASAKLREDLSAVGKILANSKLRPTKLLMNQADYDDIVKWSNGQP